MRCLLLLLDFILILGMAAGCGGGTVAWKFVLDTGIDDSACALIADQQHLYVIGTQINPRAGRSVGLIQAINRKGQPVRRFAIAEGGVTDLTDAAIADFNIYVCGRTVIRDTNLCFLARVRPTGAVLWKRGLLVGEQSRGQGICLVRRRQLAVCGTVSGGEQEQILVALLDTLGPTVWLRTYDLGPFSGGSRIVADTAGNLFVTGRCGTAESPDIFVMKLAPNGDTVWTRRYDSGGDDVPGDLTLGPLGHVVLTGTAHVADSTKCIVLSYTAEGEVVNQLAYGPKAQAAGHAITVTPEGRYYVAGRAISPKGSGVLAFQFLPDAISVWERTVRVGTAASGCAIRVEDHAYVAATVRNQTRDIAVFAFTMPDAGPRQERPLSTSPQ